MTDKHEQATLKKLMKIIYEKQKQIDKFKKQVREKQRSKAPPAPLNQPGLSEEERQYITREIVQNKKFLETAVGKLRCMENKILELQADLDEQEDRNQILQQKLYQAQAESNEKQSTINELITVKQLLENARFSKNGEISQKEVRIQSLLIENQKTRIISEQTRIQNLQLKQRIHRIESEANRALKFLYKNLRFQSNRNRSNLDLNSTLSRVVKASQQQIKTHTFIHQKLEKTVEEKMIEVLQIMNKWEQALHVRQSEWKRNFEKALSAHSFDGISDLISESILVRDEQNPDKRQINNDSNFYETSVYKRNEEQLLKQLEDECEKSGIGPVSIQKQKLVELSEVKQSLKMTKQVNEQLFDQLGRQQNIIKAFRETFTNLEKKKLLKQEGGEELRKLRSVLGVKN